MRYKILLLQLLLLLPIAVNAQTLSEYLKSNVDIQRSRLEKKMDACSSQQTNLPMIKDAWFTELTKDEKYVMANFISHMADLKCFGEQQAHYESALIAYASEARNNQPLNNWLKFAKIYRGKEFDEVFSKLDISPALDWISQQTRLKPFDKVTFLEQYPEFKN